MQASLSTIQVLDKRFRLLFCEEEIKARIAKIAADIKADLGDKQPLFIAVLNGSFIFAADLMRALDFPNEITFIKQTSYQGMDSTGKLSRLIGLDRDIKDRHVVVVEDIVDSGLTMQAIVQELQSYQPASLRVACCTYKPNALKCPLKLDYVGFEVSNLFLVGYGLDYDGYGRHLKDIYVLAE